MQVPDEQIVQGATTVARILTAVKENRVELIGVMILAHLMGISDRVLGQLSGVCF